MEVNDVRVIRRVPIITLKVPTAKCVVVLKVLTVQTYNAKALIGKTLTKTIFFTCRLRCFLFCKKSLKISVRTPV